MIQQSKSNPKANYISTSPLAMTFLSSNPNGKNPNLWILDTGATYHISIDKHIFLHLKPIIPIHVNLPNGSHLIASMFGSVAISATLTLHNVLCIPSFHVNLISIAILVNGNYCFAHFNANFCAIMQNHSKEMIGTTNLEIGLYILSSTPQSSIHNSISNDNCNLWHLRLGHLSDLGLKNMSKVYPFIPCKNTHNPCDSCHFGKQRKLPFPISNTTTSAIFDMLHADVWGPFSTISFFGHKYFLTLVDDHSRYTWVIFLKTKDQVRTSIIQFIAYIETQFNTSLKCLRTDNGTEFATLANFLLSKGILHQNTCVETPQQNGIVERKHQHILNVARSLYFHSHVPLNMWNFCVQHAIHLINRLPTPLLNSKCPYEVLFSEPPSLIHLKVFGYLGYAATLTNHRTKFDSRARKCIGIQRWNQRFYSL